MGLPDDFFDGIISYAALAHLDPQDQCAVIGELAGKLRRGGRAWFGWNAPAIWANNSFLEEQWMLPADGAWEVCFQYHMEHTKKWRDGSIALHWDTEEESLLFQTDLGRATSYLFIPPAYSLFLTRL